MKDSESKKLAEVGKYLAEGIMDGLRKYCQYDPHKEVKKAVEWYTRGDKK